MAVSGGRGNEGGVRAASRELGVNREDARRAVKVAGLHPDAKQAAHDMGLSDNRTALLAATRVAPEQQAEALRNYKPAPRPDPPTPPVPPIAPPEFAARCRKRDSLQFATVIMTMTVLSFQIITRCRNGWYC